MSIVPDDLHRSGSMNFAPMIDFLFLMVIAFAFLSVSRFSLYDDRVKLARVPLEQEESLATRAIDPCLVHIAITEGGEYKWLTETKEFLVQGVENICKEILQQQQMETLPKDAAEIKILLHIDKNAKWDFVAQTIFFMQKAGFIVHPVYQSL
jgi:biopolymer transport protein ExbD